MGLSINAGSDGSHKAKRAAPSSLFRLLSLAALVLLPLILCAASVQGQRLTPNSTQFQPELILQTGHTKSVAGVAFSPDNKVLASGSADNTVKLWDVATGRELRTLTGHSASVKTVAFSPDGRLLASGSTDTTIRIWDVAAGHEEHTLRGHTGPIESLAFSPDNRWLVSGSVDKTIILWDVMTGAKRSVLTGHGGWVMTVAFSRDGHWLASGSTDATVKLWDVATAQEVRTLKGHLDRVTALAFSPDNEWLASGSFDTTVKLWKVSKTTKRERLTLKGHTGKVISVAFLPEGQLISGSNDRMVKLWDVATGHPIRILADRSDSDPVEIESITFSPDGELVALGSGGKTIELRSLIKGDKLRTLDSRTSGFYAVAFSPHGRLLASGGYDNTIRLWDILAGRELPALRGHTGYVTSLAFSPDGRLLASGSLDRTIKLWDVATGREPRTLGGHTDTVTAVAISTDGKWLASGSVDNTVRLWDLSTGREAPSLTGHSGEVTAVSFSRDNRWLVSSSVDKTVNLFDLANESSKPQTLISYPSEIHALALSPDGRSLALAGADKIITLVDRTTGKTVRSLTGHSGDIHTLAFSPDGQRLASGSDDRTVKLWDVSTGRETYRLAGHSGSVNAVSFSWQGDWLASGSEDGSTLIWDMKTGELRATLLSLRESDDWLVVTPDGLFDGSPAAWNQILWRFSKNTFNVAPVEAFFNEFYYPDLLADILAGKRPVANLNISQKDRRQPLLKLALANAQAADQSIAERDVMVRINVAEAPSEKDNQAGSGVRDLRLFRNGSLVKVWRGDVLLNKEGQAVVEVTIPIVAGENRLTAYAFNRDNVKSSDATLIVKGAESLKRASTLYIIGIGVNAYENNEFNLKYAVPDAQDLGEEIIRQQSKLGNFEHIQIIPLVDGEATKANILLALRQLAGKEKGALPPGTPKALEKLKTAQPEDAIVFYFAGHGTTGPSLQSSARQPTPQKSQDRFYLVPHDLGYSGPRPEERDESILRVVASHSLSDEELEQAFEGVDAGYIILIIDACNSGQALEAEEKRRGPMNSKGLAQLAYEKGMYILTAAQSYQEALGERNLGHGYLTYALVEEGLKAAAADREPKDGQITLREWLDYATERVPQMQEERREKDKLKKSQQAKDAGPTPEVKNESGEARRFQQKKAASADDEDVQRPAVFYRREPEVKPLIVARPSTR